MALSIQKKVKKKIVIKVIETLLAMIVKYVV